MPAPTFRLADPVRDRAAVVALNVEYMTWVADGIARDFGVQVIDVVGMPVAAYVERVVDKVCGDAPPRGAFHLVEVEGHLAAMGGLRRVREGVAEIKRVYVRPGFRGQRLGEAIVTHLVDEARAFGYAHLVLDTAPFMHSAHRIYEAAGFTDRGPYPEVEVPPEFHASWRFMERAL